MPESVSPEKKNDQPITSAKKPRIARSALYVLLIFGIFAVGFSGFYLFTTRTSPLSTGTQPNSWVPQILQPQEPTIVLTTDYQNPFEPEYVNPFSEYKNPFDNLK
ncbi:TPA: hypothetical protein DIV55_01850 [Patescibacteria group bacterium]|nr:hypothetical protein [Patescibacteria group bacterium]